MPHLNQNGTQIYYELHGPENGEPMVLLHGLGSSGRDWELQLPALTDYRVLLIDMRGHGRSEKPSGPYSVPMFARDVVAIFDHVGFTSAHVVGLSMGGMIAFQMAVDTPERIRSMVIVNSGPALVPASLSDKFKVWLRFFIVRMMGMRKMGETLAPRLFTDADMDVQRQQFIERWAENDRESYLAAMRAIVGWTVLDRIGTIQIPTLIVAADMDYTPISAKEAYIAKMPSARLHIIENSHHAVPAERPDAFNRVLADFLAAQS